MARPARADIFRTVVCHLACSRLTGLPLSGIWDKPRPPRCATCTPIARPPSMPDRSRWPPRQAPTARNSTLRRSSRLTLRAPSPTTSAFRRARSASPRRRSETRTTWSSGRAGTTGPCPRYIMMAATSVRVANSLRGLSRMAAAIGLEHRDPEAHRRRVGDRRRRPRRDRRSGRRASTRR
jgi:hypothetical protein